MKLPTESWFIIYLLIYKNKSNDNDKDNATHGLRGFDRRVIIREHSVQAMWPSVGQLKTGLLIRYNMFFWVSRFICRNGFSFNANMGKPFHNESMVEKEWRVRQWR